MSSSSSRDGRRRQKFMLRTEVLDLYRQIFRTARKISDADNRRYVISWARKEFRENKELTDRDYIRSNLRYGTTLLNELKQSLELSQS